MPDAGHREPGESSEGCSRSGTDRGFNCPLSLPNDVCDAAVGSCVLVGRSGGAVVLVGVLGPPILESRDLSYA